MTSERVTFTMKTWNVVSLGAGKIGIQCPDTSCRGKAVVNRKKWLSSKPAFKTRSCTYCYKTFLIPPELKK